MKRGLVAWAALVIPLWLLLVLCTYWEPVMRDSWYHYFWHYEHTLSLSSLWDFSWDTYLHNNPRIGQVVTLLQVTPGPWHPLFTPLLELSLFYLLAALGLGRWPSLRRADDALLAATIVAMVIVTSRLFGALVAYRPVTGNYLFGFVMNVAWLVPYRLHAETPKPRRWWWLPGMFVLGFAAGMSNEHTDPALLFAGTVALVVFWRRGERLVPWAWVGLAGLFAGTLALYFAPGQDLRYDGLATHQSMFERIGDRGAVENARVFFRLFTLYLWPLLAWIALGAIARWRKAAPAQPRAQLVAQLALVILSVVIVGTLLASPKQGPRLYFASISLACTAVACWVVAHSGRFERWLLAGGAAFVFAFASWRMVPAYREASASYERRITALTTAPRGATVHVKPYAAKRTRWFLGEDLGPDGLRHLVAEGFGLAAIELDQRDPTTPPTAEDP